MLLLAFGLTVWIPYRSQQLAAKRLQAIGAEVRMAPGPSWVEELWGGKVFIYNQVASITVRRSATDEHLRAIEGLTTLRRISVSGTRITDEGLKHLRGLTRLEKLSINDSNIIGEGLIHLTDSPRLHSLDLHNTHFNNDGLRNLAGLKRLAYLNLDETEISDEGLKHIGRLTSLHTLSLEETKISDEGLRHLAGLPDLRGIYTDRSRVSERGIEYLRATFPHIIIHEALVASFLASLEADRQREASHKADGAAKSGEESLVQHEFLSDRAASRIDADARVVLSGFWSTALAGNILETMKFVAMPYVGRRLQESIVAHERAQAEQELVKTISRASAGGAVRAVIEEIRRYERRTGAVGRAGP